jgi:methionine biosynthesis protein MetW
MVLFRKLRSFLRLVWGDLHYIFAYPRPALGEMDYESYWREIGKIGVKERARIFSKVIKRGSSVIDIGCGDGSTLRYLIDNNDIIAEGVDISSTAIQLAKAKQINAWVSDITEKDFHLPKKYGYIILSEVLEHISNSENLLRRIRDHFQEGILISAPNIGLYRHRLRLLFGRFPIQWAFHPGEHLRFWTSKDFCWWVHHQGFVIVESYPSNGFPFLYKLMPSLFANAVVYVLKRSEPIETKG